MKLEIDISSIIYKDAKENRGYISVDKMEIAWKAIADGKPLEQEPILDKIRKQIKSDLRAVEIALEVLEKNDPLIPKMEGAKETLENCLEIIDKAESEKRE